ncbi:MAG TPA: SigB/SigF/SigG family RNA polymerase sigma factor [Clostridiaceae bacterium]|nr:SigB/SigF/SigG family RNA polymerase sigma factor [Clostridiaceae bacterium]
MSYTEYDDADLFKQYSINPTVELRNKIVSKYMYLTEIISRKFLGRGIDYEDINQVASIALIKAVERFKPEIGVKFASFAAPTIIGELKRFFRDKGSVIRIPRRIYESYQKVINARDELTQQLGYVPRVDEIANHLNMSDEAVLEIIESRNVYNMQSFDSNAYENEDVELHEVIGENDVSFEKIENRDFIEKILDKLDDSGKSFIKMRYFKNMTQKQIAEKLGVSQMYVSRLERKLIKKFQEILKRD